MEDKKHKILIVDDDNMVRLTLADMVHAQFDYEEASNGNDAINLVKTLKHSVVLLDIQMDGLNGIETLIGIKKESPLSQVIMVTGENKIDLALKCGQLGALDYLVKGTHLTKDVLLDRINKALLFREEKVKNMELQNTTAYLNSELNKVHETGMIGNHSSIQEVQSLITTLSASGGPILITGENGVGKELVARAINARTKINGMLRKFIAQNITNITDNLFESELFGHVKGSFTGANTDKMGLIEAVGCGDLFLDEIGEFPLELQPKLLRVVEYGDYKPLGATSIKKAKCRFIFATNKTLAEEVAKGRFREDLYYRISSLKIHVPSLRERKEDIELLAKHFVEKISKRTNKKIKGLSDGALTALLAYNWPGNIRELQNCIERAIIMVKPNSIIGPELIKAGTPKTVSKISDNMRLKNKYVEEEKQLIEKALKACKGNKVKAAQYCGIPRIRMYRKINEYKINVDDLLSTVH